MVLSLGNVGYLFLLIFLIMLTFGCDRCGKTKKNQRQRYFLKDADGRNVTTVDSTLFLGGNEIDLPILRFPKRKEGDDLLGCLDCWNLVNPVTAAYKKVKSNHPVRTSYLYFIYSACVSGPPPLPLQILKRPGN
jgi:hypothetical protein